MKATDPQVMKSAARWFSRVREGGMTEHEDQAWASWMRDDVNQQAYETLELAWEFVDELADGARMRQWLEELDAQGEARRRHAPSTKLLRWGGALAAAGIATLAFLFWRPTPTQEYVTAVGEQKKLMLEDGSEVTLNTNSSMTVHLTRALREISLIRGEADFKVAKDAARPFEVAALHGTTRAVGTEFDVKLDSQSATVTVMEGTVLVRGESGGEGNGGRTGNGGSNSLQEGAAATVASGAMAGSSAMVSAGQAVSYTAGGELSAVRAAGSDKIRAWKAHHWVFNDETLADALQDYNRYVDTHVEVRDASLAKRHISGVFRIGDSAAFLNAVEQALKAKATKTDHGILIEPR